MKRYVVFITKKSELSIFASSESEAIDVAMQADAQASLEEEMEVEVETFIDEEAEDYA